MFAFGWLRVGSFSGCICTKIDFFGCNCAWNMRVIFFCCGGAGVDKYARFWLAQGWEFWWVHLYQGRFFGCNCAWNMRVDFFLLRGGGGGQVCSPLAGSGLGVSVGAFVPGSNG